MQLDPLATVQSDMAVSKGNVLRINILKNIKNVRGRFVCIPSFS